MRTDREQLNKITEAYDRHLIGARRKRKRITIFASAVLAIALLASSVLMLPGLLKRSSVNDVTVDNSFTAAKGSEYYIGSSGVSDAYVIPGDAECADAVPEKEPSAFEPGGELIDKVDFGDSSSAYYEHIKDLGDGRYAFETNAKYDGEQIKAGLLTGAELRDRRDYTTYLSDMEKLLPSVSQRVLSGIYGKNRVEITVKNGETPLCHVKAELFVEGKQNPVYTAISDNAGKAYLFCGVTGEDEKPLRVVLTNGDEKKTVDLSQYSSFPSSIDVQMSGGTRAKRLDLMFMIDTTGSMGDELSYLKSEISDIIIKIGNNGEYPVRTSVNFYRDEGDDYIVHATPFSEDIDEVLGYIKKEYAAGGGDTPEAVHTALDCAVNGHEWDVGAEKLLFLVLDAPPHDEKSVYESLVASITIAAAKGIRVIPIVSSGSDALTEYLMRTYALLTGGTYTFLTDHSGIGAPHAAPTTDYQYTVEALNSMIVRIAKEYLA